MHKRNWWAMSAAALIVAAACSSGSATPKPASQAPASAAASQAAATPAASKIPALPTAATGYAELDKALGADQPYKGKKVTIQVQWIGGEGDNFESTFADFEKASGIDIVVDRVGSSHETVLRTRIEGNDKTLQLAMLAQPSPVVAYAKEGKLVDIATFMDPAKLTGNHPTVDAWGLHDGSSIWGIPYKLDIKSTVWYPIKAFAAKGYKVPTTWEELTALSDKIVQDGSHPWCIGMEAGTATGWQATDWLEDIMLRTAGIDKYQQWITHQLPFNSPEVTTAMQDAAKIFFTQGYVDGGGQAIIATHQTDPMDPMFNDNMANPGCWMQKQATWYGPDFFPDVKAGGAGTVSKYKLGEDVGLFYFPPIDSAQGSPLLTAGDTLMVIKPPDGSAVPDEVKAVAEFLSTPQGTQRWIEAGSAFSTNTDTPKDWYQGYKATTTVDILSKTSPQAFDASDQMPAAVGSGAEWKQLSSWISGNGTSQDIPTTLSAIDAAWPTQ